MANKNYILDKERLSALLSDARELRDAHGTRYEANSNSFYYFGHLFRNLDELALNLFERREGFITTGISLHRDDIKIYGRIGLITSDGTVFVDNETVDYLLTDFIKGTTISTFGDSICDLVQYRNRNGNTELKSIIVPQYLSYALHTKKVLAPYLNKEVK